MIRWVLVRHGETEWNFAGKIQGHTDVPLSETGWAQAAAVAEALSGMTMDAVFSSDLKRASETAHQITDGRGIEIRFTDKLRELNYGAWEGLSEDDVMRKFPEEYSTWRQGRPSFAAPGGETWFQLMERVRSFVQETAARVTNGNILLVGHGGSIRALGVSLLGFPVEACGIMSVSKAGISIIDWDGTSVSLVVWNDTSHYRKIHGPD